jgi:hypothetical protein
VKDKPDDVPRFGEVAPILVDNGYDPVPLHYGQKNPCAGERWQEFKYRDSDCSTFAQAGTGILCGRVVALDIDVRRASLAEYLDKRADEIFGIAPRRIGQPPKVLRMLEAAVPFQKMATRGFRFSEDKPEDKSHRVEILAKGQQFVAFNIHPDTGKPYVWNGAGDPRTVPIGLLPAITEAQARAFIAEADELLARFGRAVGKLAGDDELRQHEANEDQLAKDPALLRQALASIPNPELEFDDWIRVLYATKGALGSDGLADFLAWSAKAQKHDPANAEKEYRAAKPVELGAGTIYYLASRAGWARTKPKRETPAAQPAESGAWPDPVNIFAELAAPEFCVDDAPRELSTYPMLYAQQTGIDYGIALLSSVVSAAAAIPDQIQICASSNSNWFAQARLWGMVIAPPGAGKSPAQREMIAPLWKVHGELDKAWSERVRELEAQADDEEKVEKPPRPRVIVADTTIEALSDVLRDNERGVLVATDEFDAWIGAMDQYKSGGIGKDRGEWLRLFDGGPHSIERVTRKAVFVPNWGVSILTATTPAAIKRLAKHLPEDGLIQRFIIVLARRQKIVAEEHEHATMGREREAYLQTIQRLWRMPADLKRPVKLCADAHERFNVWRAENLKLQEALGSLDAAIEGHIAKYPTLALRLALTFHCAQVANFRDMDLDPAAFTVTVDTLELALRFLKRASQLAVALYLGRKGGSQAYELAQVVGRWLITVADDTGKLIERRDIIRRVSAFKKADEYQQNAAMRVLVSSAWLAEAAAGYSKSHPTRYTLSPLLAAKFAAMARQEREFRAMIREKIAEAAQERRDLAD